MLESEGLTLAVDRLTYFSHWITPESAPRRYDTRFFAAIAPDDQEALPDNVEAIHHVWVNPARRGRALSRGQIQDEDADDPHAGSVRAVRERARR